MPDLEELTGQVKRLSKELDKRRAQHDKIEPYLEGETPFPPAVEQAKLTKVFRHLMPTAEAPWGALIVDSKLDRLELSGIRDVRQANADRVWAEAWQPNGMDAESKLGHGAALLDGRCFATVWADEQGKPDIALDDVTQMVVEFAEGSRRKRTAALRRWVEDKTTYATLYRPDGVYKFKGPDGSSDQASDSWEKRTVDGEDWPLNNSFGVVPVVEVAVNRRLKPGRFPYARGEFAHCTGLIDRINLLTFLGLVVAFWMGFPMRGVIGEKIRREVLVDDDGNALIDEATGKEKTKVIPPVEMRPDSFAQFTNPDAKTFEFAAADRKNLSVFADLQHLAVITKTPRHYFPMEGGISNIATETVMAYEGAMHAGVTGHKSSMGEGWEEVNRLCGFVLGAELSPQAEMDWMKHESRSLAEQADAFVKLSGSGGGTGLPWVAAAEIALNLTHDQIGRYQGQQAMNPILKLLEQDAQQNGNGSDVVPAG